MADLRITELPVLAGADIGSSDELPIADLSASETKRITAGALVSEGVSRFVDDGTIPGAKLVAESITATELDSAAVTTAKIDDQAVTTAKLADGAATTAKINDSAVTTSKLADGAVTAGKLGLTAGTLSGTVLQTGTVAGTALADSAIGTSQLADSGVTTAKIADSGITTAKIAEGAVTTARIADGAVTADKIPNTSIAYGKLNIADGSIPAAKLVSDSITSSQLASSAVSSAKLASGAVGTTAIAEAAVTDSKVASGISGSKISSNSLNGSSIVDASITGAKIAPASINRGLDISGGAIGHTNTIVAGTANGFTYDAQGHITAVGSLTSIDIPSATTTARGGVSVPSTSGLTVSGAGVLTHTDSLTAGTVSGITYNASGHITATAALAPSDLPIATGADLGAVIVSGPALTIDGSGNIGHTTSPITPGSYAKVTVDAQGHITAGTTLQSVDIPSLDASKITTGTFPAAQIGVDAITASKLADYSTAQIGEALPTADFIGQFFFNPLDKNIYLWDGNVWQPVGVSLGELIFAGTYDASTNEIASVTSTGAAIGLVIGDPLPNASSTYTSYYVVVAIAGTGTAPAPVEPLAPPDIILCDGTTWTQIDVSSTYISQTAANVSFTPAGTISATNVQTALEEVASEATNATNLTSGTVAVSRGGTGFTSYTKGDLIAASDATALSKLGVGTNGQVLSANSATATGLQWTTPTNGTVTSVTGTGAITVTNGTTTPAVSVASATTSVVGVVQLSDSTSTASSSLAATSTAVKAAYDLANAALPKTGGTVTGTLEIGATGSLVFEGSTANDFELTLNAADVTADRVITLPDGTGTVLLSGSVVNADIASGAEIAVAKLANGTARQLLQTAANGTDVEWTSNVDLPGTLDVTGQATFDSGVYIAGSLVLEGTTADDFEVTIACEPTADRTVTLPNATTTLAGLAVAQTYTAAQRGAITALTDGATITPDFALANNWSLSIGGNRTLANPTNLTAGQSGVIYITQDGTGSRTLAYGSAWDFAGGTVPTLSTAANAVDCLAYAVRTTGSIAATLIKDVK